MEVVARAGFLLLPDRCLFKREICGDEDNIEGAAMVSADNFCIAFVECDMAGARLERAADLFSARAVVNFSHLFDRGSLVFIYN